MESGIVSQQLELPGSVGLFLGLGCHSTPAIAASALLLSIRVARHFSFIKIGLGLELDISLRCTGRLILLQKVGDLLVRLQQRASENRSNRLITVRVERRRETAMANASGATCNCQSLYRTRFEAEMN
jgi:hypothetical protein